MVEFSNLPKKHLSLRSIIQEAVRFPWRFRRHVGFGIFVCAIVSMACEAVGEVFYLGFRGEEDIFSKDLILDFVFLWIPQSIIFTVFAVFCHRLILVGEPPGSLLRTLRWTSRETRFLILSFGLYVVGFLFVIPIFGLILVAIVAFAKGAGAILEYNHFGNDFWGSESFSFLLGSIIWGYFLGRFSLILPATAIDLRPNLNWAWSKTIGNGWQMAILVGLLPLTFSFLHQNLHFPVLDRFPGVFSFIQFLCLYVFGAIEVALLSSAYRKLCDE